MPDQPSLFDAPTDAPAVEGVTTGRAPKDGDRLYLADALALAYRAHFAFISRPLINSKGLNTSAAYGFVGSLLKLLEDEQPEHIAVVFDAVGPGGTFRDALYAAYKAHRPPMPDGLRDSLPFIKRLVEAFDIPVLEEPGVEADDVIGTLARRAEAEGVDVVIVSPDKDFRQLLSPRVSMFRPAYRGEAFDRETADSFRARYGVEPAQFIDILALLGDASDNVPGVPGIGAKTAPKLIQDYGSVENLLAHADEQTSKRVREGLQQHREQALLSKQLVTIMTDVELDVDWHTLCRTPPDVAAVAALFDELEFGGRMRTRVERYARGDRTRPKGFTTLPDDDPSLDFDFGPYEPITAMDESSVDYTTALSRTDLPKAVAHVEGREAFSVDTETTSVDPMMASLVGVSLAADEGRAAYVPTPLPDGTPADAVLDVLRGPLEAEAVQKIGHNVKYDLIVLARHGVRLRGPLFDTMVAHYLADPEASHKLDDVSGFYLNYRPQPITELIGTGKNARSMRDVPIEQVGPYACEDADVALRLVPLLREKLGADGLLAIAEEIEFPLIPVLADMEMAGVKVDTEILKEISEGLGVELERLEAEVHKAAGKAFNIGSPKQLGEVLFAPPSQGGLGLTPTEKTSSGAPSTAERVLHELATEHPLPALVLDWRRLAKLKSTYVDKLPELIHPETGRIHTDFNQTVTATGRLSCLPAGTFINTARGLVGIETVQPGEYVRTPYGPRRVLAWQATGVKPTLVLRLSNGITLRCSPEHRLRSRERWRRADALVPGDPVYMTFAEGQFGSATALKLERTAAYQTRRSPRLPERWTPELAELVGYFMADGHIARSPYNGKPSKVILAFGWDESDLMDYLARLIENLFGKRPARRTTRTCPVLEISGVDVGGAFEQLGAGGLSGAIRVPPDLFSAPERVVAAFLRGYFEGDGCVGPTYGISVRSVSRAMLEDVQQLLTLFGLPSGVGGGHPDPRGYAPRHILRILGDRSKRVFCERIGFLSERKRQRCARLAARPSAKSRAELLSLPDHFDLTPVQPALYEAVRNEHGRVPGAVFSFTSKLRGRTDTMTLSRAEWIAEQIGEGAAYGVASFLEEAVAAHYFEVTVAAVGREQAVPMFDIAVEDVEQYTAQGIVVHNSSNPNLQNIPIRTEQGREIRRAFVAEDGCVLLAADYAQIELRILAHMSGDAGLVEAFREGLDIHTATAARVFDVPLGKVTRPMRNQVKQINYGIPYGISAFGIAQRMRMGVKEAQGLIDQYRAAYPAVLHFLDGILEQAREQGYVETLLGRRRYVPQITSRTPRDRALAERIAVNMPVQGTQADMIKRAMVAIHGRIGREGLKSRMILQVHDELVFEVPDGTGGGPSEVEPTTALVREEMKGALPLDVPIVVDVGIAKNWLDAH